MWTSYFLILFQAFTRKQNKYIFSLLGIEQNQVKGVEASWAKPVVQITIDNNGSFSHRCCSKQEVTLLHLSPLFF